MRIQNVLKSSLREKGLHYKDLSKEMNISQATVKRLLNNDDVSLSKLIELCHSIGLDFFEVSERASHQRSKVYHFSKQQELFLAKDLKNFRYFRLLVLKESVSNIIEKLAITEQQSNKILKTLENLELIERWQYDKIKLLADFPFKWIPNGSLQKKYSGHILERVTQETKEAQLNDLSSDSKNNLIITEILLDENSQQEFNKELRKLVERYKAISKVELISKSKHASIFSSFFLTGKFSWWSS